MKKNVKFLFLIFTISIFTIQSCKKDDLVIISKTADNYSSDFLRQWFQLQCRITKGTDGFFPPQAARAFGYSGMVAYQSVYQGIEDAKSLVGYVNGFSSDLMPKLETGEYNWALVENAAMAQIMRLQFEKKIIQTNVDLINSLERNLQDDLDYNVNEPVVTRSIAYGKKVANAIFEFSKTDGGHESYLDPFQLPYTQPTGDDKWIPTSTKFSSPLSPKWGSNRLFFSNNSLFTNTPKPIVYSVDKNSEFYKQALAVYTQWQNNTSDQIEITKFWADDPFNTCTPSGHTFNILTQLLEENRSSLAKAAVGYAMLGIAENDAFVCCWKTKYDYSLVRPVSYIKKNIDPNFATVIGTPPFPAYTSGHATEGAVGARIFTRLFTSGDGYYPFTDRTQIQFGFSIRTFTNFNEIALECANSRYYGGIHYDMDNQKGLQMGKGIGDNVSTSFPWLTKIK
jgi:hypothetical protein